jgi:D-alanine-D-alanine ligase
MTINKKNVAIICGGNSGEKVISIQSAQFVKENLNSEKYIGFKIVIDHADWHFLDENNELHQINKHDFSLEYQGKKINFDLVFNIIHGDPGENGKMQAYFEMLNIPVSSSNSIVSALTFNKAFCNKVVAGLGVKIAESVFIYKHETIEIQQIIDTVGLPCFVKPNEGGSSIGMSKVYNVEELQPALQRAFQECDQVLIETFIKGREVTCGVIKTGGKIHVLPLCEVVSKKDFFDYEAKYQAGMSNEIIPAEIPEDAELDIKTTAVYIYEKLNCRGVVRIDFIIGADEVYFLEANTIPGMSKASIVPQMARAYGWTNTELLDAVLDGII